MFAQETRTYREWPQGLCPVTSVSSECALSQQLITGEPTLRNMGAKIVKGLGREASSEVVR